MSSKKTIDVDLIRSASEGRAVEILVHLGGLPTQLADGKEHPCPKCGGTTRFRLMDTSRGNVRCSHCFSTGCGDIFASLQFLRGWTFQEAARNLAKYLGIAIEDKNPDSGVKFSAWNDFICTIWTLKKPGVTVDACKRAGAKLGTHQGIPVIAFPIWKFPEGMTKPIGWVAYALSGGTLPVYSKSTSGEWEVEQKKIKVIHGSLSGILGCQEEIEKATTILKVEGVSDLLAAMSQSSQVPGLAAITNSNGCLQPPADWLMPVIKGKQFLCCHDADKPGQRGATGKWCPLLAGCASSSENIVLPFPIQDSHGKDLRDFFSEGADMIALLSLPRDPFTSASTIEVAEEPLDPHRLARMNIENYKSLHDGGMLRYWRGEWYRWKKSRGCWDRISDEDLRCKVVACIKADLDREFLKREMASKKPKVGPNGEPLSFTFRVTTSLVASVIQAMASMCLLSSSKELNTWVDTKEGLFEPRRLMVMSNGLIDLDDAIRAGDEDSQLCRVIPFDHRWWSTISVDYPYSELSTCERWIKSLNDSQMGDRDAIAVLQEYSGYCLISSTDFHKFLCLEGDGSNGKSVFLAGLRAIVGIQNCSDLSLEDFADQFAAGDTLGKLVNISSDVGQVDKIAEGVIKKFADGSRMSFNRKGKSRISAPPTARLIMSFNSRPRFTDRSSGIWRRMLIIPFRRKFQDFEKVLGMDKVEFWQKSGELPGMLTWALIGLRRLFRQGGFTKAACVVEAIEDYQDETNPTREFLADCLDRSDLGANLSVDLVYSMYEHWCRRSGRHALGLTYFNAELKRKFGIEPVMIGSGSGRQRVYPGLRFSVDEVFGKKVVEFN